MEWSFRVTDTLKAFVLRTGENELLVCDFRTLREVRLRTPEAGEFHAGDRILIEYRGTPPAGSPLQLNADQICRLVKY